MRFGDTIICEWAKDGGPKSRVEGFWFLRSKKLGTIALMRFNDGSRDAYHSHAFGALSWLLVGELHEETMEYDGSRPVTVYRSSIKPIWTPRRRLHKVTSIGISFVLTFRGPWTDRWVEFDEDGEFVTLTHNRMVVT
jgi:hypothetical protein